MIRFSVKWHGSSWCTWVRFFEIRIFETSDNVFLFGKMPGIGGAFLSKANLLAHSCHENVETYIFMYSYHFAYRWGIARSGFDLSMRVLHDVALGCRFCIIDVESALLCENSANQKVFFCKICFYKIGCSKISFPNIFFHYRCFPYLFFQNRCSPNRFLQNLCFPRRCFPNYGFTPFFFKICFSKICISNSIFQKTWFFS